jgi:hypothetical protein
MPSLILDRCCPSGLSSGGRSHPAGHRQARQLLTWCILQNQETLLNLFAFCVGTRLRDRFRDSTEAGSLCS